MAVRAPYTVVFDLGGVLVKIRPSLAAACRAAGLPELIDFGDPVLVARCRALDACHQNGKLCTEEYFTSLRAAVGNHYSVSELMQIHRHWLGEEYSGVAALIAELHRGGIPTGALSNTNPSHFASLQSADYSALRLLVAHYPERVQVSHLLGLCKPERAIYRAYTERTRLAPSELVFFDDSASNVQGARAEGWRAFLIDPHQDTATQMRGVLSGLSDEFPREAAALTAQGTTE